MTRRLHKREIAELNTTIAHCELLINARGQHNGRIGLFESPAFRVMVRLNDEGYHLQVLQHGERVFGVKWDWTRGSPGHVVMEPGSWRADLLRLPAAHA